MPNVLDIEPVCALAKRASAKIGDEAVARRYERLATDRVLGDPRSFRPASLHDLASAPTWAREALERGERISVFKTNRGIAARLHVVARRLADTCKVAATDMSKQPGHAASIAAARRFIAKFGHVNFDVAARKALSFSRLLTAWEEDQDTKPVCPEQTLVLLRGRVWRRVTTVAALRGIGREFRNCLARTTRASGYGGMLALSQAQFWVLRDWEGKGLIVAMAPAPLATQFMEVKGPGNRSIRSDDIDLVELGIAIGVLPAPPPPPAPPAGAAAAVLLARQPCLCNLCRNALPALPRLRRSLRAS